MTSYKIIFLSVILLVGNSYGNTLTHKRIFGGENAKITNYPYQISLQIFNNHFCGGSIISERHILTAAHCIIKSMTPPFTSFRVVTGTSFNNNGGQSHQIAKVDVHPDWTGSEEDPQNDLAIITLENKIEFNDHQKKVNLPSQNVLDGEPANFTGWGLISQTPKCLPNQLQLIKTNIITNEKCRQRMIHADEIVIYKTQVCAFRATKIGACSGDSGGPLVVKNEVVGIASWVETERCAIGSPDVYTNVYAFKDFILSIMNSI